LSNVTLNIDSDALQAYTKKLKSMHKSAFPNAVRETLSKAALNVKQQTMPKSAKKQFTQRSPNFFKANSSVDFAKGYNVNQMKSVVGFVSTKLQLGKNNYAIKDLEQQEYGGRIKRRAFIPMSRARTGNNPNKNVKLINRLENIDFSNVIKANRRRSQGKAIKIKSKKQAFIRAAIMAKKLHGDEAYVLGNNKAGKKTLSRIDSISTDLKTKKIVIKRTPLYSFEKGRTVRVESTSFMKRASFETQSNMEAIFIKEAQKQFERNNKRK
jgi:hypothetical protein